MLNSENACECPSIMRCRYASLQRNAKVDKKKHQNKQTQKAERTDLKKEKQKTTAPSLLSNHPIPQTPPKLNP